MKIVDVPALKTSLQLRLGSKELMMFNTERVRGYYEDHIGCTREEASEALDLDRRTVSRALKAIRREWYRK